MCSPTEVAHSKLHGKSELESSRYLLKAIQKWQVLGGGLDFAWKVKKVGLGEVSVCSFSLSMKHSTYQRVMLSR